MLTQFSRYGRIARLEIGKLRIEQTMRFFIEGSALKGTMHSGCLGLETRVHIESDEPPERIRELVRMGEQTCYTLQALLSPVPTKTTAILNGRELAPA